MARMNIYISDDLKERMDKAEEKMNWSKVATQEFEFELGEMAKRKKVKDMNSVIQRLKASKMVFENASYREGHQYGSTWAKESAKYAELKRAYELDTDDAVFADAENDDAQAFNVAIQLIDDGDKAMEFWEGIFEPWEAPTDFGFYKGFLDGASEIYEKVKDEL